MQYSFPADFIWGSSTAAAQIETAKEHSWKGLKANDGYIFDKTSDHENRRMEDLEFIKKFGAYRLSLDWSRLQTAPMHKFQPDVVKEYRTFLEALKQNGVYIMLVAHHFTNPNWFDKMGNWWNKMSITYFKNYVEQLVEHFGDLVDNWNTFNEPAVYVTNGFLFGDFPPHKKSWKLMNKVLENLSEASKVAYKVIKQKYPEVQVGFSKNTVSYYGINFLGKLPAKFVDYHYMTRVTDLFANHLDYVGISYYGRIGFNPMLVSEVHNPGKLAKLGKKHDKMWEYYPKGIYEHILRFYKRYKKPIFVTENGICTDDSQRRIESIKDYLKHLHQLIKEGVPVKGYFHWSTIDNFEWNLGPTYRFGLVNVDFENGTFDRKIKPCGTFYADLIKNNGF